MTKPTTIHDGGGREMKKKYVTRLLGSFDGKSWVVLDYIRKEGRWPIDPSLSPYMYFMVERFIK